MAKTNPEMMRWEAQSLLITADKLTDRERRKQLRSRATVLVLKAEMIEAAGAMKTATPRIARRRRSP
jgi:hypothetical protein